MRTRAEAYADIYVYILKAYKAHCVYRLHFFNWQISNLQGLAIFEPG